ncbi:MAG TPA: DoxX family protein [Acidimicrobiales bacterium]|nr:DoxX family protein [Acidimicrobiales bacterium]
MRPLRTLARCALAWVFLRAGYDVVTNPAKPANTAGPFLAEMRERLPVSLPEDTVVVRANAAFQMGAAGLFAAGVAPRAVACGLAASLLPTTLAGHPFWKVEDGALRPNQRNHFNKNLAIAGGLLLYALGDRRPS